MTLFHRLSSALAIGVLASSCASVPATGGPSYGAVAAFYDANTARAALPVCLAALPPEQLAQQRFVRVPYHHVRRLLVGVAALPPGASVALGQRVELWPQDCAAGALSRITRIFPPVLLPTLPAVHGQTQ